MIKLNKTGEMRTAPKTSRPPLTMQIAKILPHFHDHLGPESQVVLHLGAAQVQVPILQTKSLCFLNKVQIFTLKCFLYIRKMFSLDTEFEFLITLLPPSSSTARCLYVCILLS